MCIRGIQSRYYGQFLPAFMYNVCENSRRHVCTQGAFYTFVWFRSILCRQEGWIIWILVFSFPPSCSEFIVEDRFAMYRRVWTFGLHREASWRVMTLMFCSCYSCPARVSKMSSSSNSSLRWLPSLKSKCWETEGRRFESRGQSVEEVAPNNVIWTFHNCHIRQGLFCIRTGTSLFPSSPHSGFFTDG